MCMSMLREIKNREMRMMAVFPGKSLSSLKAQRQGWRGLERWWGQPGGIPRSSDIGCVQLPENYRGGVGQSTLMIPVLFVE